jgi:catechol 2,3-dioxygenase-like lactoylglutathione lyase family enzyme
MSTGTITGIGRVVIPVTDQDRALTFYTEQLGFEKRADWPMEDSRWLEVGLPDVPTSIAIVPPRGGMWDQVGIDSRVSLVSKDLDATHDRLAKAGVDVDENILRLGHGIPGMFFLRDPDGNTLQIVEG